MMEKFESLFFSSLFGPSEEVVLHEVIGFGSFFYCFSCRNN